MKESKKITCITCPIGCQLTLTKEADKLALTLAYMLFHSILVL